MWLHAGDNLCLHLFVVFIYLLTNHSICSRLGNNQLLPSETLHKCVACNFHLSLYIEKVQSRAINYILQLGFIAEVPYQTRLCQYHNTCIILALVFGFSFQNNPNLYFHK